MNNYKAIQTEYNGYKFRSRLEARWAVFFDAVGIEYLYEPEGFEVEIEEGKKCMYLPDFYLPKEKIYCEVKPSLEELKKEAEKLAWMIDFGGPLSDGLMILGQIPFVEAYKGVPLFIKYSWQEGIYAELVTFGNGIIVSSHFDLSSVDFPCCTTAPELPLPYMLSEDDWEKLYKFTDYFFTTFENSVWSLCSREIPRVGYLRASSARFEHGEKPL